MEDVVEHITKQASTLEQRDKQYKTPIQIARKYKQAKIVHLLKEKLVEAGLADTSADAPGKGASISDTPPGRGV
jgi:hypothetical protein